MWKNIININFWLKIFFSISSYSSKKIARKYNKNIVRSKWVIIWDNIERDKISQSNSFSCHTRFGIIVMKNHVFSIEFSKEFPSELRAMERSIPPLSPLHLSLFKRPCLFQPLYVLYERTGVSRQGTEREDVHCWSDHSRYSSSQY